MDIEKERTNLINSAIPNDPNALASQQIDSLCSQLAKLRGNMLLTMYYPDDRGQMTHEDMETLDNEFQRHGCRRNTNKIGQLDVLLHTFGGDAHMGYMLAQILRDYADYINFLIPFHAASAGTLTSFSADKILFGGYAYLTPIDTSIGNFSLMSIDYFREFAIECRLRMEGQFKTWEINDAESRVESDLLLEMVKQVSAIDVENLYRQRTLTAYYADLLLSTYMFNNHPEAQTIGRNIASTVVFQYPSHEFFLDYHMCKKLGLVVDELSYTESDLAKALVQLLDKFTMNGIICKEVGKGYRMPFITLYEKER